MKKNNNLLNNNSLEGASDIESGFKEFLKDIKDIRAEEVVNNIESQKIYFEVQDRIRTFNNSFINQNHLAERFFNRYHSDSSLGGIFKKLSEFSVNSVAPIPKGEGSVSDESRSGSIESIINNLPDSSSLNPNDIKSIFAFFIKNKGDLVKTLSSEVEDSSTESCTHAGIDSREGVLDSVNKVNTFKPFGSFGDRSLNDIANSVGDIVGPSAEFIHNHVNIKSIYTVGGLVLTPLLMFKGVVGVYNRTVPNATPPPNLSPVQLLDHYKALRLERLAFMCIAAPLLVLSLYPITHSSLAPKVAVNVTTSPESDVLQNTDVNDKTLISSLFFFSKNKLLKWRWLSLIGLLIFIYKMFKYDNSKSMLILDTFYFSFFLKVGLVLVFIMILYYITVILIFYLLIKDKIKIPNSLPIPAILFDHLKRLERMSNSVILHKPIYSLYINHLLIYIFTFLFVLLSYYVVLL